jgi:cell division protein FtsL
MTAAVARRSQNAPASRKATPSRPALRVLDQASVRRRARRRNATLALFIVVLNALFLVAFVHARLVEGQQELDQMRTRISELEEERARIVRAVDEASSPAVVVERANELGMIRAEEPVYLLAVRAHGDE